MFAVVQGCAERGQGGGHVHGRTRARDGRRAGIVTRAGEAAGDQLGECERGLRGEIGHVIREVNASALAHATPPGLTGEMFL